MNHISEDVSFTKDAQIFKFKAQDKNIRFILDFTKSTEI